MADTILTERRDAVLLVTLNRPDRLNAWTPQMADDLRHAIGEANDDPDIGAIVMTGAGRGFCAGADMQDTFNTRLSGTDPGADTAHGQGGMPAGLDWVALCRSSKPLVAAVNGACVGIGLTQILSFDVIIASQAARFGIGFIKVGLVPELASTQFLTQRLGPGRARAFALTGDIWPAARAVEAGLVDQVTSPDHLLDEALGLAGRMAANPGRQLRWTKELLTANAFEPDARIVQKRESDILQECWSSPEHAAAVQAFLAKSKA